MSGASPERRLVQHQEPRLAHQRAAHREHLPLAARERSGELSAPLLEAGKPLVHFVLRRAPAALAAPGAGEGAELEVVGDTHRGEELASLGDEDQSARDALLDRQRRGRRPAVHDVAVRGQEPDDRAEQRRLAGAVGSDDADDRAREDVQRNPVHRLDLAIPHVQVPHLEKRGRRRFAIVDAACRVAHTPPR